MRLGLYKITVYEAFEAASNGSRLSEKKTKFFSKRRTKVLEKESN